MGTTGYRGPGSACRGSVRSAGAAGSQASRPDLRVRRDSSSYDHRRACRWSDRARCRRTVGGDWIRCGRGRLGSVHRKATQEAQEVATGLTVRNEDSEIEVFLVPGGDDVVLAVPASELEPRASENSSGLASLFGKANPLIAAVMGYSGDVKG